jgi:NADH-quinone oxidoreductase subunit M
MIYERRHTRRIEDFGGLARVMPVFAAFVMVIVFSSIGLPGTNGFIGEILILLGLFKANTLAAVLAATGIILSAVYMLWMYQRVIFGKITHSENESLNDLNPRELITLVPIILLIFWIGIYPKPFLDLISAGTSHLVSTVHKKHAQTQAERVAIRVQGQDVWVSNSYRTGNQKTRISKFETDIKFSYQNVANKPARRVKRPGRY